MVNELLSRPTLYPLSLSADDPGNRNHPSRPLAHLCLCSRWHPRPTLCCPGRRVHAGGRGLPSTPAGRPRGPEGPGSTGLSCISVLAHHCPAHMSTHAHARARCSTLHTDTCVHTCTHSTDSHDHSAHVSVCAHTYIFNFHFHSFLLFFLPNHETCGIMVPLLGMGTGPTE